MFLAGLPNTALPQHHYHSRAVWQLVSIAPHPNHHYHYLPPSCSILPVDARKETHKPFLCECLTLTVVIDLVCQVFGLMMSQTTSAALSE